MKTSTKKTLGLLLVITALTITLRGARDHHHRSSVNSYFDHPAFEQLASAWQAKG